MNASQPNITSQSSGLMRRGHSRRGSGQAVAAIIKDIAFPANLMRRTHTIMKFAALIEYTPDAAKIAAVRPQHREYLKGLLDTGRLAISGPFAGDGGGLLVYEAESMEEAEAL